MNPYTTIDQAPAPTAKHHLLPANLGALANVASRETYRFATNAVHVCVSSNGYLVEATDGKSLVRVRGEGDDPEQYPSIPALESAPNGHSEGLIPARAWKDAFKSIPKRPQKPILLNVALVLGEHEATMGTTNIEGASTSLHRLVDGRFPDVDAVLPKPDKVPLATVRVDAKRLADLLKVANQFAADERNEVTLAIYPDGAPILVTTSNGSQQFTGLVMSLT